jgi:hypothetical protein
MLSTRGYTAFDGWQTVTIISLGCDDSRSTRTRTRKSCVLACQMKSHIYCSTDDRSTKHALYERVMIHPMGRVVSESQRAFLLERHLLVVYTIAHDLKARVRSISINEGILPRKESKGERREFGDEHIPTCVHTNI